MVAVSALPCDHPAKATLARLDFAYLRLFDGDICLFSLHLALRFKISGLAISWVGILLPCQHMDAESLFHNTRTAYTQHGTADG